MKTISGKRCKVKLLELGEKLTQAGTLSLELPGAQQIWESAQDGNKVTETEKNSMRHMITNYSVTDDAKAFFEFWMQEEEVARCKGAGLEVVNEVKCDRAMIQVADIFAKRGAGRPLTLRAAEGVWFCALDGKGVTRREKDTLGVIYHKYNFDALADAFLKNKLEWLGIAQSVAEAPAPGERVSVGPDAVLLRTSDALALASLPAPRRLAANLLLDDASSSITLGQRVRVEGLTGAKELNGKEGTVQSRDDTTGRYVVEIDGDASLKSLQLKNLTIVNAAGSADQDSRGNDGSTRALPSTSQQSDIVSNPRSTLQPESLQVAVAKSHSSHSGVLSWLGRISSWFAPAEQTSTSKQPTSKRKRQEETEQSTSAPKRQKQSDDHAIKLQDLREMFELCDENNDGFISKIELIKSCRKNPELAKFFGLSTTIRQEDGSRTRMEERFQEINNAANRAISWAELLAYYRDRVVDM